MEQGTGIEPAFTAWEAVVLPIYEPCVGSHYNRPSGKFQLLFHDKKQFYPTCRQEMDVRTRYTDKTRICS